MYPVHSSLSLQASYGSTTVYHLLQATYNVGCLTMCRRAHRQTFTLGPLHL